MSLTVRGIQSAFEICLAEWSASGWPAFLTPIRPEAVAHQHRLDARIAQHRVAHRPAAVKVNEIVLLRYRSERLDVGVVTVYVPPSDEEIGRFARWGVRDRRAQFDWIDVPLAQRPRQQRLCKRRVPGPARLDFRERGPRLIGTSVSDGIVEQSKLADKVARGNRTHLPDCFLDLCAPIERHRRTQ